MLQVTILCVGKLKEKFYTEASAEYVKRLGAYCRVEIVELPEAKRPRDPSPAETAAAVTKEGDALLLKLPKGAVTAAMCIEGKELSSEDVAELLNKAASSGAGKLCFVIGGSDGLDDRVKKAADERISMSRMTFPHHLARVMLLEQIYRGFKILEGSHYHK